MKQYKSVLIAFIFAIVFLGGAFATRNYRFTEAGINPMITNWIWIGGSISFLLLLFKPAMKRLARKEKGIAQ